MAKQDKTTPPPRKEPGLIARLFSSFMGFVFWVSTALVVSIVIEWVGITWFWPEQGHQHAKIMLQEETHYLNQRVIQHSHSMGKWIYQTAVDTKDWIAKGSGMSAFRQWAMSLGQNKNNRFAAPLRRLYLNYQDYILVIPLISQLFTVRLAIIVFSLPAFVLFMLVGIIDGLVERDLRRWGGGRESSNLYNIARKAVVPTFVIACVVYISLPVTVHPGAIIMPFSVLLGMAVRVTFGRLKKYF